MLMRVLGLIAITAIWNGAWAQTNTGSATGVVVDDTGAVVPDVVLQLMPEHSAVAVSRVDTDSLGMYLLLDVQPGTYTLTLSRPGFIRLKVPDVKIEPAKLHEMPPLELDIGAASCGGPPVTEVVRILQVPPETSEVEGVVRDGSDRPIEGALVSSFCGDHVRCGNTVTDAQGKFALSALRPESTTIQVIKRGYRPWVWPEVEMRKASRVVLTPALLEHCPNGICGPILKRKRPLIVCE